MASTTSLAFPNMFDVARNRVAVLEDTKSVVNRSRLLILTEPTELYNNADFGVGLKRHLWQYNKENQKAIIKERIISQLRLHEPCVESNNTSISDGLLFTGSQTHSAQEYNQLKLTVVLTTIFGDTVKLNINDISDEIFNL